MGHQVAGNAASFPTDFTAPDDGDPRSAVSVNVAFGALGDRTAYLKSKLDAFAASANLLEVLNLAALVPLPSSLTIFFPSTLYDPTYRKTYVFFNDGATDNLGFATVYGGGIRSTFTLLTSASNQSPRGADVDGAGNIVIAVNDRYVWEITGSTGTNTRQDVYGSAYVGNEGDVAFDPVSGRWIWIGLDGVVTYGKASTNRTTWSSAGTPFSSATYTSLRCVCRKATGTILAVALAGTSIKVSRLASGSVTWTALTSRTTAVTSPALKLSFDPSTNTWYLAVTASSGTPANEVWSSSDDGTTFTKVATLNSAREFTRIQPFTLANGAAALVAGKGNDLVYSTDGGATWLSTGEFYPLVVNLSAGNGRVTGIGYIGSSCYYFATLRTGVPGLAAIT